MFFKRTGVAIAAFLISAGTAMAAPVTYNFSGNTVPTGSLSFPGTGSAPNLTVTANEFDGSNGNLGGALNIGQYAGGLGICSGTVVTTGDYCDDDQHTIDGWYANEMAVFTFDQTVTLTSVRFSLVDRNDDFAFRMYTPNGTYFSSVDPGASGSPTYTFAGTWTGTVFGIGAQGDFDNFKIRNMTVAPIPLPASGLLLIAALAGLAGRKRWTAA